MPPFPADSIVAVRRPVSLLSALVAVAATSTVAWAAPAAAFPAPGTGSTLAASSTGTTSGTPTSTTSGTEAGGSARAAAVSRSAPGDTAPLRVRIESLAPSYVPARGRIEIQGSVTNISDERWRAINVHAFMGDQPITSSAQLAAAADAPFDADVGDRITTPGTFDAVGALDPGQTVSFSIQLRRGQLPAGLTPGVYWFGVHALGNADEPRDGVADGRARTFLPLVPQRVDRPEAATVVIPIRRPVRHTRDGRIRGPRHWATALARGGRLSALAEFGSQSGALPVSWLVDPAVPDAVARLVAGNPPRSLADTVPADPASSSSPEPSTTPSGGGSPDDDPPSDSPNPVAEPGTAWLNRLKVAMLGNEVLTLPYGDIDLAGAARHDQPLYERAASREGSELAGWGLSTTPAAAAPDGFLPPDTLQMLDHEETVVLDESALPEEVDGPARAARVAGHRTLFASSQTAQGGPGPEPPLTAIALRQRVLAEAAVRLLFHDRAPLLTVLPDDWVPEDPRTFWSGLDVDWLSLGPTSQLPGRQRIPEDRLSYPVAQELAELDKENFTAAEQLIGAGQTLDHLLTRNDQVASQTLDDALTSVSYAERDRAIAARLDTLRAVGLIEHQLHKVRIRGPRKGVTLSSDSGSFAVTVENRLDHPVTVAVDAVSLGDVTVKATNPLELTAHGRQTVLLDAVASSPGVHYVRLLVTDETGTPLGAAQRVPIRSAQVSDVIWLILGAGVGLLFLAIALRVVRRVRSERR